MKRRRTTAVGLPIPVSSDSWTWPGLRTGENTRDDSEQVVT